MNRKDIISKLLSEGFSTATLSAFNDKQITSLYSRIIKEDETKTKLSSKTPNLKTVIKDLKNQGIDDIEITEDEEPSEMWWKKIKLHRREKEKISEVLSVINIFREDLVKGTITCEEFLFTLYDETKEYLEELEPIISKYSNEKNDDGVNLGINENNGIFAKKNLKEWVSNLVDTNYSSFTSKNEILEMISSKIQTEEEESETLTKIPEFMTYDSITANAPTIAPTKPKTTPTTAPGQKPKTPYSPGPGKNPRPKAIGKTVKPLAEDKKINTKK